MKKDKVPVRKLATNMIKINRVRDDLQVSLNDRLAEIQAGIMEEKWNTFKSIMYKVTQEDLATAVKKNKD